MLVASTASIRSSNVTSPHTTVSSLTSTPAWYAIATLCRCSDTMARWERPDWNSSNREKMSVDGFTHTGWTTQHSDVVRQRVSAASSTSAAAG